MAKRRRLDLPRPEDIAAAAAEVDAAAARPTLGASAPPIARVAAETASAAAGEAIEARRAAAAYQGDAMLWREAQRDGRVAMALPLGAVVTDFLSRDRVALDEEAMAELRASIRAHGLRMPIEVLRLDQDEGGEPRYGLISGWRRVQALRTLWAETGDARFATAAALVRAPDQASAAYVAMVEENEIRADLSHYERGRIAVVAAGQGVFRSVDAAVDTLFAAGSKARRSKIRSFALIHEQLGDLLAFGPGLSERAGLRLASALRDGAGDACRRALGAASAASAEAEWSALEPVIAASAAAREGARSRGGRPRAEAPERTRHRLGGGVTMEVARLRDGFELRLRGAPLDDALVAALIADIRARLAGGS